MRWFPNRAGLKLVLEALLACALLRSKEKGDDMLWRTRKIGNFALNEPHLQFAKQARDEALRMPLGDARDRLLRCAEASELAIIERWLAPLNSQKN